MRRNSCVDPLRENIWPAPGSAAPAAGSRHGPGRRAGLLTSSALVLTALAMAAPAASAGTLEVSLGNGLLSVDGGKTFSSDVVFNGTPIETGSVVDDVRQVLVAGDLDVLGGDQVLGVGGGASPNPIAFIVGNNVNVAAGAVFSFTGTSGASGQHGPNGASSSATGSTGTAGATGSTGSNGVNGTAGSAGTTGQDGLRGEEAALRHWVLKQVCDYVSVASGPDGVWVQLSMSVGS